MIKPFLLSLLIGLFLSIIPTTPLHQVHAQESGRSLSIIPPKFELFANPGDTVTEKIRIRNDSDFPVTYQVIVEDFGSTGEEGHVALEEESPDSLFSLATWIAPSVNEIILQPGEEQSFSYAINVPKDAEPGGHYASILFQSTQEDLPGVTDVTQRIGSLILLRVSGNIEENANIETFTAPGHSQTGPIPFTLRVVNDGNVHIRPKGTIIVTNLFGKKVDEIPLDGANVLPGATRKMETEWENENLFGSYKATLVATYGQQNLPLTAATKFNVFSNTALILIAIAAIAIVFFLISLFSGRGRLSKALKALTQG